MPGGHLFHGVQAEVAAVGENRGEEGAYLIRFGALPAWAKEVGAETEVVLDLD